MKKEIKVNRATINDIEKIRIIGKDTFVETFAESNTEENMQLYLENDFSIGKLSSELNNINSGFYLATIENKVIGYLKINKGTAQNEFKDKSSLEIERIYVSKEYHGKKAGQILYDRALKLAIKIKAEFLWLGVWENNFRAISFYKKNGLIEFDKHIFKLGEDLQTDILMKLTLVNKQNKIL